MNNTLLKYFTGELSASERYKFLQEVDNDEILSKVAIIFSSST